MSESFVADKKLNKSQSIRQAIAELGMDADSNVIRDRAAVIAEDEVDIRSVYQMKSNIKTGRDTFSKEEEMPKVAKTKTKAMSSPHTITKPKRMRAVASNTTNQKFGDLVAKFHAVRNCINAVGGKENLLEILQILE